MTRHEVKILVFYLLLLCLGVFLQKFLANLENKTENAKIADQVELDAAEFYDEIEANNKGGENNG